MHFEFLLHLRKKSKSCAWAQIPTHHLFLDISWCTNLLVVIHTQVTFPFLISSSFPYVIVTILDEHVCKTQHKPTKSNVMEPDFQPPWLSISMG